MPFDMLMQEARGMTDDALMEVVHYMQFLKIAPPKPGGSKRIPFSQEGKTIYRKPGLYKGKIKIEAGFDDPLDDFEEFM